ncbi:MAG TPA: carbamoyltransferase HypF [Terriglobia bacterium]|nr:carbamoyltransferase HypF [Terriglobia bacterium]
MLTLKYSTARRRKQIHFRGIVQGVGFRPFVFRLAQGLGLSGYVLNSSEGVIAEIEGSEPMLTRFLEDIRSQSPPLAEIAEVTVSEVAPNGEHGFRILESLSEKQKFVLVSPDVGTCQDCLRDFTDPGNRRYAYPFTNCTNCGPRYTIIQDIPYDRPATTMAAFEMCARCQAEYDDPGNRRFHAQPNACPDCGPSLALMEGNALSREVPILFASPKSGLSTLQETRRLLLAGQIVAIKGLGGFHLACDAENHQAVCRLRERKRRSDKPFALMARDLESIANFCFLSDDARNALLDTQRPIVILPRRPESTISPAVAPNNRTLGVMLPYTPLHYLLFSDSLETPPAFKALVMTSGNLSEEPIVSRNRDAWPNLRTLADTYLLHNRPIHMRADDSVVRIFEGEKRVLRRSRGFTPYPIDLGIDVQEILACGGELKNTFCLTRNRYAILSQHIGDLENYETLVFFEETLANLKKLFHTEPRFVAHDLHPLYISTKFARELPDLQKIGVQHHHAHIASCMAENHLREKVIGVAFDGTGYGTDGQIWGGEFMVADFGGFERRAHFRYIPLAGGDTAVRQPWRSALSYLRETFGGKISGLDLPLFRQIPQRKLALVETMLAKGINTVDTSSCGRLFDAVASILGLRHEINFEGQAAIDLEMAAEENVDASYPFDILAGEPWEIDMRPAIKHIVLDIQHGKPVGEIAAVFHNTLAKVIGEVCQRLRAAEGLNKVCLSGGTFQNMLLLARAVAELRARGFEIFLHANVPPNDGGISLGQALIANELIERGG